jgi:hypothetical protein
LFCAGHGMVRHSLVIQVRKHREINQSQRSVATGGGRTPVDELLPDGARSFSTASKFQRSRDKWPGALFLRVLHASRALLSRVRGTLDGLAHPADTFADTATAQTFGSTNPTSQKGPL